MEPVIMGGLLIMGLILIVVSYGIIALARAIPKYIEYRRTRWYESWE